MVNVLVICVENAIRSQIAEAYFNYYAKGKGLFFSAGIHCSAPDPYAVRVMAEDNIDLSEQTSKSLKAFDGIAFDHVITVCDPDDKSFFSTLDYQHWHHLPVPDPSQIDYNSEEATLESYRSTRDELKRQVLRFIGQELSSSKEEVAFS